MSVTTIFYNGLPVGMIIPQSVELATNLTILYAEMSLVSCVRFK